MVTILACPDPGCGAPATLSARWTWPSTDGPVEHVQTHCMNRHSYTQPQPVATTSSPHAPDSPAARMVQDRR
jgi:hypothetical protein